MPSGTLMDGAGMSGLMYFKSNDEDPYINIKDVVCQLHFILFAFFLQVYHIKRI